MACTQLGLALRKARDGRNIRLFDMAKAIGLSSSDLSSLEHGRYPLTDELVARIINYFERNKQDGAINHWG